MPKEGDNRQSPLILGIFILLLLLIIYKWFEYSSLKKLINTYDNVIKRELTLTSDINKQEKDAFAKVLDFYKSGSEEAEMQSTAYEALTPSFDLYRSLETEYSKLIKDNSDKYERLSLAFKFLIGPKVTKAKQIIKDQSNYYKSEIKGNENVLIESAYFKNLFMIINDMYRINDFDAKAQNKEETKKKFYLLASIEKYTRNDFKFFDEENIKNYAPNEYQGLVRYKRYFATYYELIRLVVKDQENSQAVADLSNKLRQDSSNINIDFQGLFEDKKDSKLEETKKTISIVSDQLKNIYELNEDKSLTYPFVKPLTFTKHYLWHCQLYDFKTGFYNAYKKKYPSAKNVDELLNDLNTLNPKTTDIDKRFDKNVLKLENDEKELRFTCIDKENRDEYVFVLMK